MADHFGRQPHQATGLGSEGDLPETTAWLPQPDSLRSGQDTRSHESEVAPPGGDQLRLPSVAGYQILRELGRGGMGVVYQARDVRLGRLVALKMIRSSAHASAEDLARFRTEAEAVARLQHPNIVQIYEIGDHEGCPYLALEYLEGGSLAQRLAGVPAPAGPAAELVRTLAQATHAAHQGQIIHRDLKPANVLLTRDGIPKVADFGLAKRLDTGEDKTQTGAILGTPSYMAPEQAGGKVREVGPATDVYALGAILYELLTGRPPFRAETPLDTALQVVRDEPVPPSRLQPKVPRDLETICLKCLQKAPHKRFASAAALALDLQRFLEGKPLQARPVPAWERALKWIKRRPSSAALLGVSSLAVLSWSLLSLVYTAQLRLHNQALSAAVRAAEERRQEAEREKGRANRNEAEARRHQKAVEAHRVRLLNSHNRLAILLKTVGRHREAEETYRQNLAEQLKLAAAFPDEVGYRLQVAVTYSNLGNLLQDRSELSRAEEAYRQALKVQQELARSHPADSQLRQHLARVHVNLGNLLVRQGRDEEAEKHYRQGLRLQKELVARSPADTELCQELARTFNSLGNLFLKRHRAREGEDAHRESLRLKDRLARDHPEEPSFQLELGRSCINFGLGLLANRRDREAEDALRRAVLVLGKLVAKVPAVPEYRWELAFGYLNLGDLFVQLRRAGEAEKAFRAACPLYEALVAKYPLVADYRHEFGLTLGGLAACLLGHDRPEEAQALLEQAIGHQKAAVRRNPKNPSYQNSLREQYRRVAEMHIGLGQYTDCARVATERSQVFPRSVQDAYESASHLARCLTLVGRDEQLPAQRRTELTRAYGDKAVALLRQAITNGYQDGSKLKGDVRFASLRDHPEFRKLLTDLTEK